MFDGRKPESTENVLAAGCVGTDDSELKRGRNFEEEQLGRTEEREREIFE